MGTRATQGSSPVTIAAADAAKPRAAAAKSFSFKCEIFKTNFALSKSLLFPAASPDGGHAENHVLVEAKIRWPLRGSNAVRLLPEFLPDVHSLSYGMRP